MRTIETSITIESTPEQVWQVLTDFESYPAWNPFIKQLNGELIPGTSLEVELCLPGQAPMLMTPKVVHHQAGQSFSWLGHLWRPGVFDGEHIFELEVMAPKQTRLIHREQFGGILAGPLLWLIGGKTKASFIAMNEALRKQVEEK